MHSQRHLRFGLVGLIGSVLLWGLSGCVFSLPDEDDGLFECKRDDDCSNEYVCRDAAMETEDGDVVSGRFCVPGSDKATETIPPGESDVRCSWGCASGELCAVTWDERGECVPECSGPGSCGPGAACYNLVVVDGDSLNDTWADVCVPCDVRCSESAPCTVVMQSDHVDEVEVDCVQVEYEECSPAQPWCSDPNQTCVATIDGTGDCVERCDPSIGCDEDGACVAVTAYAGGEGVTDYVCRWCLADCAAEGPCSVTNPSDTYDAIVVECLPTGSCNKDTPCPQGQVCVVKNPIGEAVCVRACDDAESCGILEACVNTQVDMPDVGQQAGQACKRCAQDCTSAEPCREQTSGVYYDEISVICAPASGDCEDDSPCAGRVCAADSVGNGFCLESCDVGQFSCTDPDLSACTEIYHIPEGTGTVMVCVPCDCSQIAGHVCMSPWAEPWYLNDSEVSPDMFSCGCEPLECQRDRGVAFDCTPDGTCACNEASCQAQGNGLTCYNDDCVCRNDECLADVPGSQCDYPGDPGGTCVCAPAQCGMTIGYACVGSSCVCDNTMCGSYDQGFQCDVDGSTSGVCRCDDVTCNNVRIGLACVSNTCVCDDTECANDTPGFLCDMHGDPAGTCICNDAECRATYGDTYYCRGTPAECTNTCASDLDCPANTECDAIDGICRIDCSLGACNLPDMCADRHVMGNTIASLCMTDPCGNASCNYDCVMEPITAEVSCLGNQPQCTEHTTCTTLLDTCMWDGQFDRRGQCRDGCTPGDCGFEQICEPVLDRETWQPTDVCVGEPLCALQGCVPGPSDQACIHVGRARHTDKCVTGCRDDSDCNASVCVRHTSRYAAGQEPLGVCRMQDTCPGSCGAMQECLPNSQKFNVVPDAYVDVCAPQKRLGQSCTGDADCTSNFEGNCVRDPNTDTLKCRPSCSPDQPCHPGESCVSSLVYEQGMAEYTRVLSACIPGMARYQDGEVATTSTWFLGVAGQAPTDVAPNIAAGTAVKYTERWVEPGTDIMNALVQFDEAPPSFKLFDTAGVVCPAEPIAGVGHFGRGELDSANRVKRVLVECSDAIGYDPCTDAGQTLPYIKSWVVTSISDPGACTNYSNASFTIADDTVSYPKAGLGDGLFALVSQYPAAYPEFFQSVRVAELVNRVGNRLHWAHREFLLAANWVVKDIKVSRDIVAWISQSTDTGAWRLEAVAVREFFADGVQPFAAYVYNPPAGYDTQIRDLAVDEHWVAIAEEGTSGQRIFYVALDLTNPASSTTGTTVNLSGSGQFRVRPSLHRHYLLYTNSMTLRFKELASTAGDRSYNVGSGVGQPLLGVTTIMPMKARVWFLNGTSMRETFFQ